VSAAETTVATVARDALGREAEQGALVTVVSIVFRRVRRIPTA
jgi:hypothetical protein